MHKISLLALLLAATTLAGPLRFVPDTVRSGRFWGTPKIMAPESTKVTNTSNSTVTISLVRAISKLDHSVSTSMNGSRKGFLYEAPNLLAFAYTPDTTIRSGSSYIQPLSRTFQFFEAGRLEDNRSLTSTEISLAPNQSVVLGVFRVAACWMPAARALATTNPVTSCVDESFDLVFGSTANGFDTLHILANQWLSGSGTAPRPTSVRPIGDARQFSANGRPAMQDASTIALDPTGSIPRLR